MPYYSVLFQGAVLIVILSAAKNDSEGGSLKCEVNASGGCSGSIHTVDRQFYLFV